MNCLYCQEEFQEVISLATIFQFREISPTTLCPRCAQQFQRNDGKQKCQCCDKATPVALCSDCQRWQALYPTYKCQHRALYTYNQGMHEWFQAYKFQGDIRLAAIFSRELRTYFNTKKNWLIIPIPLSKKRLKERGFNQVECLLEAANVCYQPILLKKQETRAQTAKSKKERLASNQSFTLKKGTLSRIHGQKIVIVDDVYTTGRTMFHAYDCLLKAQPKRIMTFSLAR